MRNRSTLIRFGMVAIVVAVIAAPATAFYWIGWPGANPITPPTIVPNTERVDPPGPGGEKPPPVDPPTEEPPKNVPEPTTMGIAAAGLGVLAFGWWKKRKKK